MRFEVKGLERRGLNALSVLQRRVWREMLCFVEGDVDVERVRGRGIE
jgi:hypothetical protein